MVKLVEPRGIEPLTSNMPCVGLSSTVRLVEPRGIEPLTSTMPL